MSETLAAYLHLKKMLLALDNCEHMVEACAQFADHLLSSSGNLKMIATSREAFGLTGEHVWQVPTLTLPDAHGSPLPELLARYEGIQLFVERANAVKSGFEMTARNAFAVSQVCRRLDGIPLAIELAAARVNVLSPEEIPVRLGDRFSLLTTGSRTSLPRHKTLRATVDWSHDLLAEPERILFRRLSVFVGGFTRDAAITVCSGQGVEGAQVLDLVSQLVNKSLVMLDAAPKGTAETRYRMLETIREYAHEKLVEAEESDLTRDSHLRFFTKLAEQSEAMLSGEQVTGWKWLDAEVVNLRAAIEWSMQGGDANAAERVQAGLLLAAASAQFFESHFGRQARDQLKQILSSPRAQAHTIARAKALGALGFMEWSAGNLGGARVLLQEAVTTGRELGDKLTVAWSLVYLGAVADFEGDHASAPSFLEEALAISGIMAS